MDRSEVAKLAGTKSPITRELNKCAAANEKNEFDVIIESAKKLTKYAQRILDQWPQLKSATKPKKAKAKAQKKPSNPTPVTDLQSQVAELTKSVAEVTKTVTGLVEVVAKIASN